jgi:hypothetical protein
VNLETEIGLPGPRGGNFLVMKIRKVINRPIRFQTKGVNVAGGVTGAVSANVNEGGKSEVESHQQIHIVQRSNKKTKPTSRSAPREEET